MERISKTCASLNKAKQLRVAISDYRYDTTINCEDSIEMQRIKHIIFRKLSIPDKTLLLLYAEHQSFEKVASLLNVARNTVRYHIQRIRKTIKQELNA